MLKQEGRSVKDAAFSARFTDQRNFGRVFRKFAGVMPTRYREGLRK